MGEKEKLEEVRKGAEAMAQKAYSKRETARIMAVSLFEGLRRTTLHEGALAVGIAQNMLLILFLGSYYALMTWIPAIFLVYAITVAITWTTVASAHRELVASEANSPKSVVPVPETPIAQITQATSVLPDWLNFDPPGLSGDALGAWRALRELAKTAGMISSRQAVPVIPPEVTTIDLAIALFSLARQRAEKTPPHRLSLPSMPKIPREEVTNVRFYLPFSDLAYWLDEEAIREKLLEKGYELAWAHLQTKPGSHKRAHFVAFSEERKELVCSVRGTFDANDLITDLCCEPSEMDPGDGSKWMVHRGIAESAMWLCGRMEVMLRLLSLSDVNNPGLRLVCVGHSLGAGTAALLATLLKKRDIFQNVRAYCFACPMVGDAQIAHMSLPYTISVINRDDIVPRIRYQSFQRLVAELATIDWKSEAARDFGKSALGMKMKSIRETLSKTASFASQLTLAGQKPDPKPENLQKDGAISSDSEISEDRVDEFATKAALADVQTDEDLSKIGAAGNQSKPQDAFLDIVYGHLQKAFPGMVAQPERPVQKTAETISSGDIQPLENSGNTVDKVENTVKTEKPTLDIPELFVPGRVFYLYEPDHTCKDVYGAVWTEGKEAAVSTVELSATMVTDHLLDSYARAFASVCDDDGLKSKVEEVEGEKVDG